MNAIEAYASTTSVVPGETVTFHVRTEPPHYFFRVDIYRKGKEEVLVDSAWGQAGNYATPANAHEIGCGWPVGFSLTIPGAWSSGVYLARLTTFLGPLPGAATTDVLFVVRAAAPGTNSKICFQLAVNTDQAYNEWGGKSLYGYNSTDGVESNKVSFDRPVGLGHFYEWEYPFVQWLENNGFEVEYATSVDLHASPHFLDNYQLLLSVGHDEYWSKEMRDHVEAFVANGGNVAFFSGNVCWWQVRFENANRTMVCYRDAAEDPLTGIDNSRVTVKWRDDPVNRTENKLTGVSFVNGAGWWDSNAGPRPAVGYRVRFPQHWVFDTTGLNAGDEFGADSLIVGYETDAAVFVERSGVPMVTGGDGTPRNFIVLGTADLSAWQPGGYSGPDGHSGMATMGIFRNRGAVFTAGTIDWSHGLLGSWNAVSQITQNILRRLSCPFPPSPSIGNAGFEEWQNTSQPAHWLLEGAGRVSRGTRTGLGRRSSVKINARLGETWISHGPFWCEGRNYYRVGCWARARHRGATIRLQSTNTWRDFATAGHSGSGKWEYLCAVGKVDSEGPMFPARVKIQVARGVIAWFDDIRVDAL